MTTNLEPEPPERSRPWWAKYVTPIFIILLALLMLRMGLSMRHHRFFRGGPFHTNQNATQP